MKDKIRTKIEQAIVSLVDKAAMGILVKNNMIITAAHCVKYNLSGTMDQASGYNYYENISTLSGKFKVAPLYIELISDIAILESMDDQIFFHEYEEFDEFCRNTIPIKISKKRLVGDEKIKVYIYTHKKKWIEGSAFVAHSSSYNLMIEPEYRIKKGTSGSGVFNEEGEIVGIVNKTSLDKNFAMAVRPILALPPWMTSKLV